MIKQLLSSVLFLTLLTSSYGMEEEADTFAVFEGARKIVLPSYPVLAKRASIRTDMEVEFTVSAVGDVEEVEIKSGSHVLFDHYVIQDLSQWKFEE